MRKKRGYLVLINALIFFLIISSIVPSFQLRAEAALLSSDPPVLA